MAQYTRTRSALAIYIRVFRQKEIILLQLYTAYAVNKRKKTRYADYKTQNFHERL